MDYLDWRYIFDAMSKTKKQVKPKPEQLGIYIRVSDQKQLKGISLRDQELRGIELAKELGWKYEVFKDGAQSGGVSYLERPALNSLVEKILVGEIGGLYYTDIDRLSREVNDGNLLLTYLIENEVRLFDVKGEIDIKDENQEALQRVRLVFADLERKKIKARVIRALDRNALDGKVTGGPLMPYGYKKGADGKYVIDKEEAKVVKKIYKHALEGKGTKVISNILNEEAIPTKRSSVEKGYLTIRGKKQESFQWRDAVVYNILTNTMYIGQRKYKDKIIEAPSIIDEGTFYSVAELLKTRNNFKNTTNKYNYLLKGLLFCEKCGRPFHGHKRENNKDNAYKCNSSRYKGQFCGNTGISIDYIEDLIWSQLMNLDKAVTEYYGWQTHITLRTLKTKRYLYQNITRLETANENLIAAIEQGKSIDLLSTRLDKNNAELEQLREEQRIFEKGQAIFKNKDDVIALIKKHTSVKATTFEKKLAVARALINRITISNVDQAKPSIKIEYRIDALTGVKLGKQIELTAKMLGNSVRNKDRIIKSTSLIISQDGGEVAHLALK